ncbi:aspartate/glutamate racemase family protein [Paractinoplanes atraurantiacus]|uniref:Aspartate racemase n=1 Tax=Paractinoplanes atraurantiacus TaxID=1036182 RepID=A0A285JYP0_9ACTN|nr:aspartate/glutamate racemase family protein [Actinoplanes atraurantiacus]SNY65388.1 aspartate racemase [Actinoplanes atraurantiacus]
MRVLGLLGGMSWESTDYYYQRLNRGVRERLGGLHSAHSVTYTVDFAEVERMQVAGAWDEAGKFLGECAQKLERAGAEGLILCTNTMHRVVDAIEDAIDIPVLHIADGTATALLDDGVEEVALLGTRYTMEQDFYRKRLEAKGLHVVVPEAEDRDTIHRVIFDELCQGRVEAASRQAYVQILEKMPAEAVIFGCTEIGLLLDQSQTPKKVYDTTLLHVEAALDWMLSEG